MFLRLPAIIRTSLAWVVLAAVLPACTAIPKAPDQASTQPDTTQAGAQPAPDPALPANDLDADLLYQLMLGEIAMQRGQYKIAADALTEAALQSRDYRVAQRASRIALQAKEYDKLMQAAELWNELQPNSEGPVQAIAVALIEENKIDDAEKRILEMFGRNTPQVGTMFRRLSDLLSRQPNRDGAMELMTRLVSHYPQEAQAYYAQAYLAGRLQKPEHVSAAIDRALQLKPDWEEAALAKLTHLVTRKDAKPDIARFAGSFLERNPKADKFRLQYARYLVDRRDTAEALIQFDQLVANDPKNTDAMFAAALLSMQLEQFDVAERYLQDNLKLSPHNDQLRLYLGRVAAAQERYDDAANWYRQVKDDAHYLEAQTMLADIIAETEGVDAALAHLQSLTPGDQEEYVQLILSQEKILRDANELDRAKTLLDDAVNRNPENMEILYARGLVLAQLNMVEQHEHDMRKILEKNAKNAHALNALGYTLADATERFDEAHDLIQQALAIRPDDPFILDSMGWVQYRLGNHKAAIDYLERALGTRSDAEIAAHLGEVLWVTGERERAQEVWQQALGENPDNEVLLGTIKKFQP